jgi:protein disulfide-isomerase
MQTLQQRSKPRFKPSATLIALALVASVAIGSALPYDETADAKAEIRATLADAQRAHVPVLVVFGANWCADCKILDTAFKSGASAPLIARNFRVVKVNVGRFDRNVDIAQAYGVPLKSGIPAVAILSEKGKVVYATREGELADARKMGDSGIYDFFSKVATTAH